MYYLLQQDVKPKCSVLLTHQDKRNPVASPGVKLQEKYWIDANMSE